MEHTARAYAVAVHNALIEAENELEAMKTSGAGSADLAPVYAAIGQGWADLALTAAVQETGVGVVNVVKSNR